jgi:hypothetical protein
LDVAEDGRRNGRYTNLRVEWDVLVEEHGQTLASVEGLAPEDGLAVQLLPGELVENAIIVVPVEDHHRVLLAEASLPFELILSCRTDGPHGVASVPL